MAVKQWELLFQYEDKPEFRTHELSASSQWVMVENSLQNSTLQQEERDSAPRVNTSYQQSDETRLETEHIAVLTDKCMRDSACV